MTQQLHDVGEEALIRDFFVGDITKPTTLDVGVYDDSVDGLGDADDLNAITTEPSATGYARQSVGIDGSTTLNVTAQDTAGDWEVEFDDLTFDVSNVTSGNFDSYFVVINFQSDDKGDTASQDHLFASGPLDRSYDAGALSSFTLTKAGLKVN